MVERSDEAPLLFWAEGPAVSAPPPAAEPGSSGSGGRRLGGGWSAAPWDGEGPAEAAGPPPAEAEEDQIVAVFVVTFDPRTGERRRGRAGRGAGAGRGVLGAAGVRWMRPGLGIPWRPLPPHPASQAPLLPPRWGSVAGPSVERPVGAGLPFAPTGHRGSTARLPLSGAGAVGICRKRSTRGIGFGLHPAEKLFWREEGAASSAAPRRRMDVSLPHSGSRHREFVDSAGASPVPRRDLGRASAQRCLESTNLLAAS